ncbi:MAG: beta-lactamase family protein [Acidobacteria bacterium]|nr:beta-lactamase family protein [Acidobacteriota bacterium]
MGSTIINDEAPLGTFSYTNTGYNIAGMVMEEATGSAWQDLLRELRSHFSIWKRWK